jgi:GNAT superfamily N-acetyltransferase
MDTKGRSGLRDAADEDGIALFEEVLDISTIEFQEAMKIYAASFPEHERRSFASIETTIISGKSRLIIGSMNGRVVLMALLYPLAGTTFMLLDYLAISKEHRGRGLGQKFISSLLDIIDGTGLKHLLVEVENPHIDDDDAKTRRARFYKRLGFREIAGLRYLLPPLQGTSCTEMILMVLSKEDEYSMDRVMIKDAIVLIFEELYGRGEDDDILSSIMEDLPDQIELV